MLRKLRIKFICITMGISTVMLCMILGLVIGFTSRALEEQSIRMMRTVAPFPAPPGMAQEVRLPYFTITTDFSGEVMVGEGYEAIVEAEQIPKILALTRRSQTQIGELREYSLRFWKDPGPRGERIVFADMSSEIATMKNLVGSCVVIGVAGFFLFLAISVLLAKWAIRPVERAWQQQKQFVADASHELKTPLTVIMTNAELLQSTEYSEQQYPQFSESIYTMAAQMRGLVEGLLELARVDNGAVKTGFAAVDMSTLISEGLLPFEPLFFERDLTLISQVEAGISLSGSAGHLRQVLDILLDNALKYAVSPGDVRIFLKRQGTHCLLSVENPGVPLSRQEQRDIFKRFYRVDKARSRDGSYGLGLSIAQGIVEEHHGRIWAQSEAGKNIFFVQLPVNK